ncbi:MAG: Crp/Fnr family transcriptional regulator [Gammaproteobacteria bacterium]
MISSTLSTLEKYSLFQQAPLSLREEMGRVVGRCRLNQGSYFFCKGASCKSVVLIGEGKLRIFLNAGTRREVTLYHVGPGKSCPVNLLCALTGSKAPAYAFVEAPLEGATIPIDVFQRWVAEQPSVRQFVFAALAERLVDDVFGRVEEITFQRIDRRLADYFLRHFDEFEARPPVLQITHEQIAQELGSAREVITRMLKTFESKGAIKLARGHIILHDETTIRAISNEPL